MSSTRALCYAIQRLSETLRETLGSYLLDVPTNFCQERPLNPLLPTGWKDIDELETKQVLKSYFQLWKGGWDLTAPSVRTQNTKLRTSSLFRACRTSLKSGQWQIQRPETRAIKKGHNEILQLTTFRWNWSRDTVRSLGRCGHSYIHMVCCVCGIFMRLSSIHEDALFLFTFKKK